MKVNYHGKIYETIETIILNNRIYHIIYGDNNVDYLEEVKAVNGSQFVLPNQDLTLEGNRGKISSAHLTEQVVMDHLVKVFRENIKNGKYSTKEELLAALSEIKNKMINDVSLGNMLASNLIFFNETSFQMHIKSLLEYFDKTYTDTTSLDLQNISSFEVTHDGITNEYFKHVMDDKVHVVENRDAETFDKQILDVQNDNASAQLEDGLESADASFDIIRRFHKVEVDLEELSNIKPSELGREEGIGLKAVSHPNINNVNRRLIGNPEAGFYIDKANNYGVIVPFTDLQNKRVEVSTVAEKTIDSITDEVQTVNSITGEEKAVEVVSPLGVPDEELTDDIIDTMLIEKKDSLTAEQISYIQTLRAKRKREQETQNNTLTQPAKVKKHPHPISKREAAFVDILVMALVTEIIAFVTLLVIMLLK